MSFADLQNLDWRIKALLQGKVNDPAEYKDDQTTTATRVWNANPNAIQIGFVNLHASQVITIWVRPDMTVNTGLRLGAGGGSRILDIWDASDLPLLHREWYAIASGAATTFFSWRTEARID